MCICRIYRKRDKGRDRGEQIIAVNVMADVHVDADGNVIDSIDKYLKKALGFG